MIYNKIFENFEISVFKPIQINVNFVPSQSKLCTINKGIISRVGTECSTYRQLKINS